MLEVLTTSWYPWRYVHDVNLSVQLFDSANKLLVIRVFQYLTPIHLPSCVCEWKGPCAQLVSSSLLPRGHVFLLYAQNTDYWAAYQAFLASS